MVNSADMPALRSFLRSWAEGREIETHAARIYLGETTALKVKRPVRYAYLDFTDAEVRKNMLGRELTLNRAVAPQIYRDLVPLTCEDGQFAIDGPGEVVEWALRMWRFPPEAGLDRIVERNEFTDDLAERLGGVIHDLHEASVPSMSDGVALVRRVLDGLIQEFDHLAQQGLHLPVKPVLRQAAVAVERVSTLLADRAQAGFVRRCHGDLHLRNIVLLDGRPVPFDALEFSEDLAICDVLYDLAFLLMDMQHKGAVAQANRVLNAYFDCASGDEVLSGLAALPLFLALRALVRAVVSADLAAATSETGSPRHAQDYLQFASQALSEDPPKLYVVAGLSGTGKTTLARLMSPDLPGPCGALLLRSDIERKRGARVAPLTRLPASAYSRDKSKAVYDALFRKADVVLRSGSSVILDAVFAQPEEREAAEAVARRCDVSFRGLWLEAPELLRSARVTARQADASDATAEIVARQSGFDIGLITWERWQVDAAPDVLVDRILKSESR
ncbi:MAG: AAA family ATPase [Pseudomonadota bacterium]